MKPSEIIGKRVEVEIEFNKTVTGTVLGFEKYRVQVQLDDKVDSQSKNIAGMYRLFDISELKLV